MATAKKKTITRFGPRYGRTIKDRLGKIESGYRGKHKCPFCSYTNVTRTAAGIWECSKCSKKFTSRAYQLTKPTPVKGLEAKQQD
jgi:large subunit ribosomal protein L37Ae